MRPEDIERYLQEARTEYTSPEKIFALPTPHTHNHDDVVDALTHTSIKQKPLLLLQAEKVCNLLNIKIEEVDVDLIVPLLADSFPGLAPEILTNHLNTQIAIHHTKFRVDWGATKWCLLTYSLGLTTAKTS